MKIYDLFPFIWFWKWIARNMMLRMYDIQDEYGPTFNTLMRTIGHHEYQILDRQVNDIVAWCKNKEQSNA